MKTYTPDELTKVLAAHAKWLRGDGGNRADLSRANLSDANLSRADLSRADLSRANLSDANLSRANLSDANLSGVNLSDANLSRANLSGICVCSADLYHARNYHLSLARTEIVPREGEVIGWKKCRDDVLVKLRIPPAAKRSNATGRKCRAEFAEVLEVVGGSVGVSLHDGETRYVVGETVRAAGWCEDHLIECAPGIHFYITREEAEAHV